MTFSSSVRRRDSPSSPRVKSRGAWFVADLKRVLPVAAFAAAGGDNSFAGRCEIFEHETVLVVHNDGARRNTDDQIFGAAAVAIGALSVFAASRRDSFAVSESGQGIDSWLGNDDDAAAIAAVAAIGTAAWHVFFAAKADAAIAAAAGFDFNSDAIDEHVGEVGSGIGDAEMGNENRDADGHPCEVFAVWVGVSSSRDYVYAAAFAVE